MTYLVGIQIEQTQQKTLRCGIRKRVRKLDQATLCGVGSYQRSLKNLKPFTAATRQEWRWQQRRLIQFKQQPLRLREEHER